ncbi:hypothetical protein TraAM80_05118 [Trypanosoma rangeli]|uniref:Uncharacterized protein n=1 Tax=Trypanosoma rangeli TaxID=5698 RepID=A0A3R7NCT1_TRYRA|nr:uncharacterized protein TraAM80_05118 [Trypanosoma rangeli]RNF04471.1 hypothetical protein TraAM80_05118 [Trypanosoma rangeli]|eukprot:RNF04471.1 hypothetical protein TraAM80_05118 [Trypanosoma rangeli]
MTRHVFMQLLLLVAVWTLYCWTGVLAVGDEIVWLWKKPPAYWHEKKSEFDMILEETSHGAMDLKRPLHWSEFLVREDNITFQGNVQCGGGYCPAEAPICCGEAPHFYCAPGGTKCCFAPYGKVAACEQSAECCISGTNATCCTQGTTCRRDVNGPTCARETCTKYQTSDDCIHNTTGCAWCCAERRCINNSQTCSTGNRPIGLGETCSPCQYADTCTLCLTYNISINASDACSWCCATQSCIPISENMECGNDQHVQELGLCPVCQANGAGINPEFVGTMTQFFGMISGVVLVVGIMSCIGVSRACIYFRGSMLMSNGMRVSDVDAQMAVRRHGFGSRETASMQERVKGSLNRFFGAVLSLFRSKSKTENPTGAAQVSPSLGSVVSCTACHRIQHVRRLASVANTMKGIKRIQEGTGSNPNDDVHPVDDDIVILLPCCHAFCRPCVGLIPTTKPSAVRPNECATEAQPNCNDEIREDYIRVYPSTEEDMTDSQVREPSAPDVRHASHEEQQVLLSVLGRRGGNEGDTDIANTSSTTGQPQREIRNWREGLLHSWRRLSLWRVRTASREDKLTGNTVLKNIRYKCPKCKQEVKDVLLPENILKL